MTLVNKKSQMLLEQKDKKYVPIYKRIGQVLEQKSNKLNQIKQTMELEKLEKNKKEVPTPFQPQINQVYKDTHTNQVTCLENRTLNQFIDWQYHWEHQRQQTHQLK